MSENVDSIKSEEISGDKTGRLTNRRILVVDDNPSIHSDFRKILAPDFSGKIDTLAKLRRELFDEADPIEGTEKFDLYSAIHGEEGLEMVRQALEREEPYALAFIDIRMPPGWDGIETTSRIWQEDPNIQVVLCTAYADYSREEMLSELGPTDQWVILKKPFDPIEVRQLAHALTRKWDFRREQQAQLSLLEQMVLERTKELQSSNELLRKEIQNREQIESELRQVQKLEALGRLAAGVGHEINNPLSFLITNLDYVTEHLQDLFQSIQDEKSSQLLSALEESRVGADRIKKIVSDLKTFSWSDDDELGAVDLGSVLKLATSMVRNEIRPRARLVTNIGSVPPVHANRSRLEQVFVNLLANAAQSLPEGRAQDNEINVHCFVQDQETVLVEVSDTGPGIPNEDLHRIFDPFFTTKQVGEGTGLGLSICHRIVNNLGGSIRIDSQEGRGTTVRVTLLVSKEKLDQPKPEARVEKPIPPQEKICARILVVDDDDLVARSLQRALSTHQVNVTSSGRQAIDLCKEQEFEVVLCDVMMDDFTGKDVFEELQKARPGYEERIIFITGGAYTSTTMDFLKQVPNDYLEKPFDFIELGKMIERRVRALRNL